MKNIFWSLVLLFFAAVLFHFALEEKKRVADLVSKGYEVEAKVIDNRKNGKLYYPVLSYTYRAQHYQETTNDGANPARYSVGDQVVGIVDPENPSQLEIKSFFNQTARPILLGLFGLLLVFAAAKLVWKVVRIKH